MSKKDPPKPKLTDEERHQRFKEMAREVDASEREDAFDEAFERVTSEPRQKKAE
jgi:hypothetical protein